VLLEGNDQETLLEPLRCRNPRWMRPALAHTAPRRPPGTVRHRPPRSRGRPCV